MNSSQTEENKREREREREACIASVSRIKFNARNSPVMGEIVTSDFQ